MSQAAPFTLAGRSSPTVAAAKHFGISTEYAFLMGDNVLAVGEWMGRLPYSPAWPLGHYWHDWAIKSAVAEHGEEPVMAFGRAMAEFYDHKAHGQ